MKELLTTEHEDIGSSESTPEPMLEPDDTVQHGNQVCTGVQVSPSRRNASLQVKPRTTTKGEYLLFLCCCHCMVIDSVLHMQEFKRMNTNPPRMPAHSVIASRVPSVHKTLVYSVSLSQLRLHLLHCTLL